MSPTSRKLASRLAGLLFVPLLAWLLFGLTACTGQRLTALPPELLGTWKTSDTRYQGRFMNMAADQITFGMDTAGPDKLERVDSLRVLEAEGGQEYRIALRTTDGSPDLLTVEFNSDNGGELHLKSQPRIIWRTAKLPSARPLPDLHSHDVLQDPMVPTLIFKDHKIIYKIDCVRPGICKSY